MAKSQQLLKTFRFTVSFWVHWSRNVRLYIWNTHQHQYFRPSIVYLFIRKSYTLHEEKWRKEIWGRKPRLYIYIDGYSVYMD